MKRIDILLLLLLVCSFARAAEYTVEQVPNVHLDDGRRFVSNPDGILSAKTVTQLDQMLFSMQEVNTSEVAVVALQSIGNTDPDVFSTELSSLWGIGKQNDNGLLVLLVLDQRRIVFRTGYGLEGVLPDAICKRIQARYVIPQFREGNYDRGLLDGISAVVQILTTPEATAEIIDKNGYLHSGDLGVKTPEGNFKITGRIKDMIIRGGENIYPREIEEFLYQMPQIKDVQVAAVPSRKYGEEVGAFIILKEGETLEEADVKDFCKGKISRHKIPKYVFFIKEFPLTGSGKIQKYKLKDLGLELLRQQGVTPA